MSLFSKLSGVLKSDAQQQPIIVQTPQVPIPTSQPPATQPSLPLTQPDELATQLKSKVSELALNNEQLLHAKETMMTLLKNTADLESALKKERDKSLAIMSSMGEGMIVIDQTMRVSFINHIAEKLLTLVQTQGVGNKLDEILKLVYDPTKEDRTAVLAEAITKGITTVFHLDENFSFYTVKEQSFPVSLTLTPLPENNGGVLLFRDRTPERLVKESIEKEVQLRTRELMEEQAKLTASIDSLQRAFIMTDTNGDILLTNSHLNDLLGVIRVPWTLELVQEKLGQGIPLLGLYKECQQTKLFQEVTKVQFGSKFLRVTINPFFLPAGHIFLGILIQLEDITEDVVLQRSRDEFFSIASHELRTPLTSIRGNSSLLKQYYPTLLQDEKAGKMIGNIHESSVRLIEIVNEFLQLSRLELGKITFANQLIDLIPIVTSCIEEVGLLAKEKNLTLTLDSEQRKQLFVNADKDRLKEVVINLLSNAIKFTEKGSVNIRLVKKDKAVHLFVTDTGRGISLKNQSLLFRKFQQASDSIMNHDTVQSTGLGLYISKLLMKGMNGEITLVSSEENKGSTFSVSLPVPD